MPGVHAWVRLNCFFFFQSRCRPWTVREAWCLMVSAQKILTENILDLTLNKPSFLLNGAILLPLSCCKSVLNVACLNCTYSHLRTQFNNFHRFWVLRLHASVFRWTETISNLAPGPARQGNQVAPELVNWRIGSRCRVTQVKFCFANRLSVVFSRVLVAFSVAGQLVVL